MPAAPSPLTLRQLLGSLYLIGIALLALGVIVMLGHYLNGHFRQALLAGGRVIVERLAEDSRLALIQAESESIRPRLETAATYPNVAGIVVATPRGETLAASGPNPIAPGSVLPAGASGEKIHIAESEHVITLVAAVHTTPPATNFFAPRATPPTSAPTTPLGWVALTLTKAKLQAELRTLNHYVLTVMSAGAALVTALTLGVLTRATRPIKQLAQVMADPATAREFHRVKVYGVREAQAIATAFNALIAQVAAAHRDLTASNAALTASKASLAQQVEDAVREVKQQNAELIVAREQALAASRVKSEFLANMSHEIRTPLHGFMGFIDLLGKTSLDTTQQSYLHLLKYSASSLLAVINAVLDFSKLEAGKTTLHVNPFHFREMIESTVHLFVPNAHAKGLQLEVSIDPDLPDRVSGDRQRLAQIVRNLVTNAIKFTERGGVRVHARCPRQDSHEVLCQLIVEDTGIGIPVADQASIFAAFNQVDASTTRQQGGTGLGLAICQQLVALMQGRLTVTSQEGVGSTFHVEVPLRTAAGEDTVHESPSDSAGWANGHDDERPIPPPVETPFSEGCLARQRSGPTRVLVVDDNLINRLYAKIALARFQTEVVMVETGHAALDACRQRRYDLILMDIRMPGLDGLETTRRIRRWQTNPNCRTPIIGLTADLLNMKDQDWQAAGMNECLFKPLSEKSMNQVFARWGIGQPPEAYSLPNFPRNPS